MLNNIRDFSEKDIRQAVLRKANPRKINKTGKHWKGYIFIRDILVTKVKIPNNHNRVMKPSKSQYVCRDLRLNPDQFNNFVSCIMSGREYYKHLKSQL